MDLICRQCFARNNTCIPVSTGMLGNAADMMSLVEWVAGFWETDDQGVDVWDDGIIEGVNEAMATLVGAFDSSEQAHRKRHRLNKSKSDQKNENEAYAENRASQRFGGNSYLHKSIAQELADYKTVLEVEGTLDL